MTASQRPTPPTSQPARWRDFAHTAALKLAIAIAADEHALSQQQQSVTPFAARPVRQVYTFALLAAATLEAPVLPASGYDAREGGLSITTTIGGPNLVLTLQLEGLDALEGGAGRDVRVVSSNAAIDINSRFDAQGQATLTLPDSADIRTGVAALTVSVLDDPSPAA
jgi:hypothetical protein